MGSVGPSVGGGGGEVREGGARVVAQLADGVGGSLVGGEVREGGEGPGSWRSWQMGSMGLSVGGGGRSELMFIELERLC